MTRAFQASDAILLVKKESEQGVEVTPDRNLGKIDGEVEMPDPSQIIDRNSYVGSNSLTADELVKRTFDFDDGTIPVKVVDPLPFELLLGKDKNGSDEIELIEDASQQNSATMQLQYKRPNDSNFLRNYIGVVPSGGSISVSEDDDLVCELDISCLDVKTEVTEQSATKSILDKDTFSFSDVNSNLSMFGVTFSRLNDFTVDIDKNTEVKKYANNDKPDKPDEIILRQPSVDLEANISVSSDNIYNEILNGNDTFTTSIGFARNNGDTLEIIAENCLIEDAPHTVPEEGTVDVPVSIVAETIRIIMPDNPT